MQLARFIPIFPFLLYLFAADERWQAALVRVGILTLSIFGLLWMIAAPVMH